jgi:hypothetical protein
MLRIFLERYGVKPVRERKRNIEKSIKLLDEDPARRPFVFYSKTKLIDVCIGRFGGKKSNYESLSIESLIDRLSTYQIYPNLHSSNQNSNRTLEEITTIKRMLLRQVVKSSFLPKLSAKGKEYCKTGQNLEVPFARKLLLHSKEGHALFECKNIYRVGLLGREGEMFAKASCDFLASALINGEMQVVGVECKARVAPGTDQIERAQTDYLTRFHSTLSTSTHTSSRTSTQYMEVDARARDFHKYVDSTHEAVQLLHQAYVCGLKHVLLLVGDTTGNIIRGL